MLQLLAIMILFPLSTNAGSGGLYSYRVSHDSRVTINGKTNISTFSCVTEGGMERGNIVADLQPGGEGIIYSGARLDLRVDAFDCGRKGMNRDFYQAMGGDQSPYIQIVLLETRPAETPGNVGVDIIAEVLITINGVRKTTEVAIYMSQSHDLRFMIEGSKELLMSEFNIDPPSPVMGIIRVSDEIIIDFNMVIEANLISQNE